MRSFCLTLCVMLVIGCGSESTDQQAVTGTAGIPLEIRNPGAGAGGSHVSTRSAEEQQAVEQLIAKAQQAVGGGQPLVAVEALSQAIGIDPADSRLLRLRADVYAMAGELANAKADFSTAILAAPNDAELRNMRGYFLMTNGIADQAVADFNKAIELQPELAAAWNNRGLVYLQRREYEQARQQFARATECSPDYADAWNNLGFARLKLDQMKQALADIEQALSIKPDYITAWNNRGLINMQMQDFEEAVAAFTKAIDLAPLDPRWYTQRIAAHRELEHFEAAARDQNRIQWIQQLTAATEHLNRDAKDPARWIARGELLTSGDMFDEGIRDFTRALELDPTSDHALNLRAQAYVAIKRFHDALDDCEKSIVGKKNPTQQALSIRGDVWLAMGNLDSAIADFERAGRFDSVVVTTLRERAASREANGEDKLAAEDRLAAAQIEDALAGRLADDSAPPAFPDSESE